MASKDAASEPNSAPMISVEFISSPKTTLAALHALRYDHASTPNTGDVPPISAWENILMGKKWIAEHREGDGNTFKRSELPKPNRVNGYINDGMRQRDRLNVDCDRETFIVKRVYYG